MLFDFQTLSRLFNYAPNILTCTVVLRLMSPLLSVKTTSKPVIDR